jgi:hypothetical protein
MQHLLLIPGGLAVALGNPQKSSLYFPLVFLPTSHSSVNALCQSRYFYCLVGLLFCLFAGYFLHQFHLDPAIYFFSFWHLSTAAVGSSHERRLMHSVLGTALALPLNSANLDYFLYSSGCLFLISSVLFIMSPKGTAPAFTGTKNDTGYLPWICLLGASSSMPMVISLMFLVIFLTILSSKNISKSINTSECLQSVRVN